MMTTTTSLFLALLHLWAGAQIRLSNPSFEGDAQDATVPTGWMPCAEGSTPDILPGPWGVYQEPSEGNTYLGLIIREDGSYENIAQRLAAPLEKGQCYSFSIDLARSPTYSGYKDAVHLRIVGGATRCAATEVLASTGLVEHSDWKTYTFSFMPKETLHYLVLEAHYPDRRAKRRGNLLLDRCSAIEVCERAALPDEPEVHTSK